MHDFRGERGGFNKMAGIIFLGGGLVCLAGKTSLGYVITLTFYWYGWKQLGKQTPFASMKLLHF